MMLGLTIMFLCLGLCFKAGMRVTVIVIVFVSFYVIACVSQYVISSTMDTHYNIFFQSMIYWSPHYDSLTNSLKNFSSYFISTIYWKQMIDFSSLAFSFYGCYFRILNILYSYPILLIFGKERKRKLIMIFYQDFVGFFAC